MEQQPLFNEVYDLSVFSSSVQVTKPCLPLKIAPTPSTPIQEMNCSNTSLFALELGTERSLPN